MTRKGQEACCRVSPGGAAGKYQVESMITVDERGQTVLPKRSGKKRRSGQGTSWRS